MPVFTAFGWEGEANAIKFALTQLELFIKTIVSTMPTEVKMILPHWGINEEAQTVYLAANADPERGPYIAFYIRPMSFEMRLCITDKAAINRGLKAAEKSIPNWHKQIFQLGEDWSFHIQQNHVDEDSGEASFYQDVFKDSVVAFDPDTCEATTNRAAFLNSEAKWITPVALSFKIDSQQAAGMSSDLIGMVNLQLKNCLPVLTIFARQQKKASGSTKTTRSKKQGVTKRITNKSENEAPKSASKKAKEEPQIEQFSYVSLLKGLHLRKGFINLTSKHWPFFSQTARTETRQVTVCFDGREDKESAVWRLQPDNVARLVLGDESSRWLEDSFSSDTKIHVQAIRLEDNQIEMRLKAAE